MLFSSWIIAVAIAIQQPPVSPQAERLIAPVVEAVRVEQARQAASGPPIDLNERFLRMYRLDQQSRAALNMVDLSTLPPAERQRARTAMWKIIGEIDDANQKALLEALPPEGWFYRSRFGEGVAQTAFLIVQHSDATLWRRFLPVLQPLVASGEVDGEAYGLMFDRLAVAEGRPQRFGTQVVCVDGKQVVDWPNIEDPDNVEERRRAMGFTTTLSEYQALFADHPPCS